MELQLQRLSKHFTNFWKRRGKDAEMDVATPHAKARQAADEKTPVVPPAKPTDAPPVPPVKPVPPVTPPLPAKNPAAPAAPVKPGEKKDEKTEKDVPAVIEEVQDIDDTVSKAIDRKVELAVKRVIDESLRTHLGKPLAQFEKGIRPEIEREIADQAADVRKEINQAVPAAKDVNPDEVNKGSLVPAPVTPPPAKPPVAASINKTVINERPADIILDDMSKLSVDPDNVSMYQIVYVNADGSEERQAFGVPVKLFEGKTPGEAEIIGRAVVVDGLGDFNAKYAPAPKDGNTMPGAFVAPAVPSAPRSDVPKVSSTDAVPLAASTKISWFRK